MIKALNLFLLVQFGIAAKIPSFVHLCNKSDPEISECFTNSMLKMLPYIRKGIPELNLPAAEPFYFDKITFSRDALSSIQVDVEVHKGSLEHITEISDLNFDVDITKPKWTAAIKYPKLRLQGTYKLKGKILLFDLDGTGHLDFNITDVEGDIEYIGKLYNKNGKRHNKLEECKFNIKKMQVRPYLSNLFANSEALTKTVNDAFNENTEVLTKEFKPLVEESMCSISLSYINRLYEKFPFDQLYPD